MLKFECFHDRNFRDRRVRIVYLQLKYVLHNIQKCITYIFMGNDFCDVTVGLQLLDVIMYMKREEKDADLSIQFEVP